MLNLVQISSSLPLNYAELNATLWHSSTPEKETVSTLRLIWCVCHTIMTSHKFSSWSDLWSNKLRGCVAHPSLAAWWIDVYFITLFPVSTPDFVHPRILHPLILILHCKVNVIWWVDSKTSPCSTFQCPLVAFKDQCLFFGSRVPEFSPLTVDLLDHLNNITFSSFTKTRNPISHLLPQQ